MRRLVEVGIPVCLAAALAAPHAAAADAAAPAGQAAAPAASRWPGLRGPSYDGAVHDARLFSGADRPALKVGWQKELGSGYSGVTVADGRVVTLFAAGASDVAAAFDAATGQELWRYPIAPTYTGHDGSHNGPISTPAIEAGRVYGLGPRGQLFALDLATGRPIWAKDLVAEHAAVKPHYGFTTSPILVDGVLIVELGAGAGKAVGGFDPADGRLLWSAGDDTIEYHSPIAATIGGSRQVLAAGGKTLLGLEPRTGKVLWSYAHQGDDAAMGGATIIPVPAGEGRFFLMTKMDSSTMIEVRRDGSAGWSVKDLWSSNGIKSSYVIPVYHEGYLYGMSGRIFTCIDAANGEPMWKSREPGDGFPTLVGSHIVMITKPGTLHVVATSPQAYHELARLDLFGEHAWAAVAFAGGGIFARSMGHLARVDVEGTAGEAAAGPGWIASTAFGRFLDEARRAPDRMKAVDAWIAQQKRFPVIEPDGSVHFIYRGKAGDVGIVGDMLGSRREDPMTRLEGTDLFHYSIRLEPDAAVTYGFIVDYAKATPDPLNPRAANGLFGDVSWFWMPAWRDDTPREAVAKARQGRLERLEWESAAFEGKKRVAQVYLPAGYDREGTRRYPSIYVVDGQEALDRGEAAAALDQLMPGTIEPAVVVFAAADPENPRRDLGQEEAWDKALIQELVPAIDGRFRTRTEAASRGIAGAGNAANIALVTAFKHTDTFRRLGSLGATMLSAQELAESIPRAEATPLVIYQAWGTYHLRSPHEAWDMARSNRDLRALLRDRGHRPAGSESPEGFGWVVWRRHFAEMLRAILPGGEAAG